MSTETSVTLAAVDNLLALHGIRERASFRWNSSGGEMDRERYRGADDAFEEAYEALIARLPKEE